LKIYTESEWCSFELDAFALFLPPHSGCVSCGAQLGGMLGSFAFGLPWGEGHCGRCDYPARVFHRLKLPDGSEEALMLILQYHPDELKERNTNE
jgi:hypothetical protein